MQEKLVLKNDDADLSCGIYENLIYVGKLEVSLIMQKCFLSEKKSRKPAHFESDLKDA